MTSAILLNAFGAAAAIGGLAGVLAHAHRRLGADQRRSGLAAPAPAAGGFPGSRNATVPAASPKALAGAGARR